jgi:hypothetical protein
MWLDDQWFTGAGEALREMMEISPGQKRDMIQFLLDEGFWDAERLSWEAAVTRFNACLNPNKRDASFKVSELWALAKRFDRHQLFVAIVQDLGYEVRVKPTEERRQELLERIAVATEQCAAVLAGAKAELGRIDQAPAAPRVHSAPRHHFSKAADAP